MADTMGRFSSLQSRGQHCQCGGQRQGQQPARPDRVSAVSLVTKESSAPSNTLLAGLGGHGRAVFVGYIKGSCSTSAASASGPSLRGHISTAFATHIPCLTCHVFQERVL